MRVVIEGVNGSGKSTLATSISSQFGLKFIHAGPKPKDDYAAVQDSAKQVLFKDCVLDRITPITRLCYQFDNEYDHIVHLETFLTMMMEDTIFIHTVGRGENIIKPYYTEEHIKEIHDNHEAIRANYLKLFKTIPHFEYDFEKQILDDVFQYIDSRHKILSMI